ncbi:MAG: XRE family transcriptional regulator [Pseudomonadota bacterium]
MSLDPQISTSLGADLRSLRKSRGLTLDGLAQVLGKSVGWVSQVERDISHPNIDDLRSLANALDVPLSIFFGQSAAKVEEDGRIVRAGSRRVIGGGEIGLNEELLSPDLTDDFEMVRSVFEPGASLPNAVARPTQEVGYLISGRLTLWISDDCFDLNPGDSFRIRGEPFRWENPHQIAAVAIWVIAPPVY